MKQLALGVQLRAEAVFSSFAVGGNAEIVAALRGGGRDPLWIWGPAGSGKTHLLQALCAEAGGPAAYFPLARSLGLPPEALQGFETRRVLCLDDLDAVAGDLDWERALFRSFNEALELGTRLVFAARAAPQSLAWSLEDWGSRAAAGLVYQLHDLDEEGRIEALCLRARQRGVPLPRETAEYLLKRLPRDLGSLLDALDALDVAALAAQRRLTIPFIRAALETAGETRP
jgi:DnaA family protein